MPIDPSWPPALVADVIRMATPDLIVTADDLDPYLLDAVKGSAAPGGSILSASSILHDNPPEDDGATAHMDTSLTTRSQRAYCYVLFTSGSTGQPQGVCGTESGLVNRITWMQNKYNIGKVRMLFA